MLSALLSTNVLCQLSCAVPTNAWKPHLLSVAELAFIGALCSPASSLQYLDYGLQWLNTKLRSSSPPVQGLPHVRSMGWLQYFPCCTVITLASGGACAQHGCCWEGRPVFKDLDAAAAEEVPNLHNLASSLAVPNKASPEHRIYLMAEVPHQIYIKEGSILPLLGGGLIQRSRQAFCLCCSNPSLAGSVPRQPAEQL